MKNILLILAATVALAGCGELKTDEAAQRQAQATRTAMDASDREIGLPRIANFAQKKLLKNAYEDMDQTTLTYVYTQALDGKFVCLGQAVGYGVSLGTQFTASQYPSRISTGGGDYSAYMIDQPEPNGLYSPTSGAATIVNLIDANTGVARTALIEANVMTTPNQLPAQAVSVACPAAVDPKAVKDVKETSVVAQRN